MRVHTVQQLLAGPRAGMWVYMGGTDRSWYIECCAAAARTVMAAPRSMRTASPAWQELGHPTPTDAYAHMRTVLLEGLDLNRGFAGWAGCQAPDGKGICNEPTHTAAALPKLLFYTPLCDAHRTRDTVESMWDGPGDWIGSQ
ncbi:hypothetical protein [Streptomyces sp. NPDC002159]